MGMSKEMFGDMQEACPLTEAEEMALMEQQMIMEHYFNENGNTGNDTSNRNRVATI